jgi:hypothetical protein
VISKGLSARGLHVAIVFRVVDALRCTNNEGVYHLAFAPQGYSKAMWCHMMPPQASTALR